jgi:hypothetical protein
MAEAGAGGGEKRAEEKKGYEAILPRFIHLTFQAAVTGIGAIGRRVDQRSAIHHSAITASSSRWWMTAQTTIRRD